MKTNILRAALLTTLLTLAPSLVKAASNPCLATRPAFSYTTVATGGGVGQVTILAAGGCGWSVSSHVAWIRILSGTRGVGTGVVTYQVLSNTTGRARRGAFGSVGAPDVIPGRTSLAPTTAFTITVDQNR